MPDDGAAADLRAAYFVVEPDRPGLVELASRIDAGLLRPVLGAKCRAPEARAMIQAKELGGVPGKVVLSLAPGAGQQR